MAQSTNTSSSRLFVSMAASGGEGGIAVFNLDCATGPTKAPSPSPTQAPAVSPSPSTVSPTQAPVVLPCPAPSAISTPVPTLLSTVPELVEARLAAAVNGVDISFELGPGSSGDGWAWHSPNLPP